MKRVSTLQDLAKFCLNLSLNKQIGAEDMVFGLCKLVHV